MANKRKGKSKSKEAVPFSRLDVFKELQTINQRVSNVSLLNCTGINFVHCATTKSCVVVKA